MGLFTWFDSPRTAELQLNLQGHWLGPGTQLNNTHRNSKSFLFYRQRKDLEGVLCSGGLLNSRHGLSQAAQEVIWPRNISWDTQALLFPPYTHMPGAVDWDLRYLLEPVRLLMNEDTGKTGSHQSRSAPRTCTMYMGCARSLDIL